MTSNIGSEYILTAKDMGSIKEEINQILRDNFRPEFLNRIDEILTFNRLEKEHIRKIVDIQLRSVAERLKARRLGLKVSDKAKDFLADIGYDPMFGARPLKRAIQAELENKLAREVLEGKFPEGSTILVDKGEDSLIFKKG